MNPFSAIDLSKLPAPSVVEVLQVETILTEMLSDLRERLPEYTNTLESDPVYKILQVAAYREMLLRARINDAARSVMLAYARQSDLDHLAALYGIERQVIEKGDDSVIPPRPPVFESDDRFRLRMQLSLEGHTTAGPAGAYLYHTFTADARISDVSVESPTPGDVLITILSTEDKGIPSEELLNSVAAYLRDESVRPLTDYVRVQAPTLLSYSIFAELVLFEGPDSQLVLTASTDNLKCYTETQKKLGQDITRSGLFAALHTEGVQRVDLIEPADTIVVKPNEVASLASLNITIVGFDE